MIDRVTLLTCFCTTAALAIGFWIALLITGRKFGVRHEKPPLRKMLSVVTLATIALLIGFWIGNRGALPDAAGLYLAALMWLMLLAVLFFTVKKTS